MSILIIFYSLWIFPHTVHIENDVNCDICHERAISSERSSDILLPAKETCIDCHEETKGYVQPTSLSPLIDRFSHNIHSNVECSQCHLDKNNPQLPKMETCSSCHNGVTAGDNCYTCHKEGEKRLQEYHPPGWRSIHGEFARTGKEERSSSLLEKNCLMCHRETQAIGVISPSEACNNCHIRENLQLQVHPENFLFQHPQEFLSRGGSCAECHSELSDCRSCHTERRLYPITHNLPNWLTSTGGRHSEDARMNPENCLVCHGGVESTCSQCHGGR